MYQVKAKVLKNEEVSEAYFRLSLECSKVAKKAIPGQFVMVKTGGTSDPLLRRPFSMHRIKGNGIEILYKVIGKGTGMMAGIKVGEEIDIIGPLGRGFDLNLEFKIAIIIGGGIGIAPLVGLAEKLADKGKKIKVFIGGKTEKDILCLDDFEKIGADINIATDDGNLGHRGFITDYFIRKVPLETTLNIIEEDAMFFVCGPYNMTKKIAEAAIDNSVPCQVSLEAHMACGVGACLGCVIKTKGTVLTLPNLLFDKEEVGKAGELSSCGCDSNFIPCDTQLPEASYKRICMEGPVFDAEEVVWE